MSVTVSAVPFLLFAVVSKTMVEVIQLGLTKSTEVENIGKNDFHLENNILGELCNKEFDTIIMDKDVLLKTIEEHGATNIIESQNDISCDCDSFHIDFYKMSENEPYKIRVSYRNTTGLESLISDLGNEYSINAQEISYNKVKERLEAQNLEIEKEEIYEDNTIVLTVNLE